MLVIRLLRSLTPSGPPSLRSDVLSAAPQVNHSDTSPDLLLQLNLFTSMFPHTRSPRACSSRHTQPIPSPQPSPAGRGSQLTGQRSRKESSFSLREKSRMRVSPLPNPLPQGEGATHRSKTQRVPSPGCPVGAPGDGQDEGLASPQPSPAGRGGNSQVKETESPLSFMPFGCSGRRPG